VQTVGLGNCFDVNMDNSGHCTMQQWTKIVEAYLATKSVVLTQRQCHRRLGVRSSGAAASLGLKNFNANSVYRTKASFS